MNEKWNNFFILKNEVKDGIEKGRNWRIKDMEDWLFNFKRNKNCSCFVPKKNQGKKDEKLNREKG